MPSITGTRKQWADKDWPALAREIRARGYCRKFTDFLLQMGLSWRTSHEWRKTHPEWKAVCEGFPQKVRTFDTGCCTQPTIWRFEELLKNGLAKGVPERDAFWAAADKAISERREFRRERGKARRIAKHGGERELVNSKGRHRFPTKAKRAALKVKAEALLRDWQRWAALNLASELHGMSIAEVLRGVLAGPRVFDYYMAAQRERRRMAARIAEGSGNVERYERLWPEKEWCSDHAADRPPENLDFAAEVQ